MFVFEFYSTISRCGIVQTNLTSSSFNEIVVKICDFVSFAFFPPLGASLSATETNGQRKLNNRNYKNYKLGRNKGVCPMLLRLSPLGLLRAENLLSLLLGIALLYSHTTFSFHLY